VTARRRDGETASREGRVVARYPALLAFALLLLAALNTRRLAAQASIHAQAIPLVTTAWHMPGDEATLTEFAVVQPAVMLEWRSPWSRPGTPSLLARATLDGEGLTIADGELAPGDHGEGYYDRRHPHTYVHELVLGGSDILGALDGRLRLSAAGGPKGFVAFGTDDPMSRPPVRYPVNHHLAQILERALVIGSVAYGPISFEATWFNGDEPTYPSDWPNWERAFDSHAFRGTVTPLPGLEAQLSYAKVLSPEHEGGAGPTQEKWDASIRYQGLLADLPSYFLVEWARTEDAGGFFTYRSLLAEGAVELGRHRPYARLELTERPEEMRTNDPFRSVRPHTDDNLLGITDWTVVTAGYGVSFLTAGGRFEVRPFLEGSIAHVGVVEGLVDPEFFYGSDVLPSLSVGVRMDWGGMNQMRMGRYGTGPESTTQLHTDHSGHH
jgi:hypothetical protein